MVNAMRESSAVAATLSSWYVFDVTCNKLGFVDPEAMPWADMTQHKGWPPGRSENQKESWLYGFGFSYVYYRKIAIKHQYLDTSLSEDYLFFYEVRKSGGHVHLHYDM